MCPSLLRTNGGSAARRRVEEWMRDEVIEDRSWRWAWCRSRNAEVEPMKQRTVLWMREERWEDYKSMNDAKEGKQATEKTPHNSAHQPLLFDLALTPREHFITLLSDIHR